MNYQATRERIGRLDTVLVYPQDPTAKPQGLAVFCHGFGAGGDDLVGLAGELLGMMATEKPLLMAFPAAPLSLDDQGMPGSRAWWMLSIQRLINAMEDGRYEQIREEVPEGIDEAREALVGTINELLQRLGLDESRLMLGGFSQGAMLSVETACLGLANPPKQLCLYSGALICERRWTPAFPRIKETEIYQSHGTVDMILPLQVGRWLTEAMEAAGCQVKFQQFNGPHTIPMEAIEKTAELLTRLVAE